MTSDLDAARAALDAAGARQAKIDAQMAIVQGKLDKLAEERKNKGRGRPCTAHASKVNALESQKKRLQDGLLPGESNPRPMAPQTGEEARESAARHPQHHADASAAPAGRPAADRPSGGARAGGRAAGSGAAADGDEDADDDDERDPSFYQYYRVSPNQRAFNETVAREYVKGESDRSLSKVEPYELIGGGCQSESIGLGPVHICAPHLHMGLPLPPCPRHGWKSVDEGKLHTRGCCPARRVFGQTVDEWLVGVVITCDICRAEKDEAEGRLAELEEDDELERAPPS